MSARRQLLRYYFYMFIYTAVAKLVVHIQSCRSLSQKIPSARPGTQLQHRRSPDRSRRMRTRCGLPRWHRRQSLSPGCFSCVHRRPSVHRMSFCGKGLQSCDLLTRNAVLFLVTDFYRQHPIFRQFLQRSRTRLLWGSTMPFMYTPK